MHITKYSRWVVGGLFFIMQPSWAEQTPIMSMSDMQDHPMPQMHEPKTTASDSKSTQLTDDSMPMMTHLHGSEIYMATEWQNKWQLDRDGTGQLQSELTHWIGSDINKLYLKAELEKRESQARESELHVLYSRNIASFWDVQTGLHYRQNLNFSENKHALDAVFGVHGLAPYFFETDAYAYVGQHQYLALKLDTRRDVLLTQKWIASPFFKALWVLQDQAKTAQKKGLAHAQLGVQTHYEMNKQVMPFIEFGYEYENGLKASAWQHTQTSHSGWVSALGFTLKF
ncbi:copper resistance protein B [Acinetobacter sp. MD2(2019)]|uniref:copper resistance protein B n=1 Tax=Acinetobacter sp. MD2(2019) TaxID=2605273 RepID=UPI002D1EE69D|nr:copper resistance protein B [Acinetobacter sp. MD2(2019)]MEB3753631.1 copper resistance protein B [Acinetobacter sp. MD2(2019)]